MECLSNPHWRWGRGGSVDEESKTRKEHELHLRLIVLWLLLKKGLHLLQGIFKLLLSDGITNGSQHSFGAGHGGLDDVETFEGRVPPGVKGG
jgi:hypothetical protein